MCYNKVMFNRIVLVANLAAVAVLLVMLNFTTPADIGPLGVLFFFVLIYILMYSVALLVVKIFWKALQKKSQIGQKGRLYAAVLAFVPIMLLLAQSVGSLNIFTIILTVLFAFLGCFLVYKRA